MFNLNFACLLLFHFLLLLWQTFRFPTPEIWIGDTDVRILSHSGRFFLHYQRKQGDKIYSVVQLIGSCSMASGYRYEYTFCADNGKKGKVKDTMFRATQEPLRLISIQEKTSVLMR
jgi:hypothetical protein